VPCRVQWKTPSRQVRRPAHHDRRPSNRLAMLAAWARALHSERAINGTRAEHRRSGSCGWNQAALNTARWATKSEPTGTRSPAWAGRVTVAGMARGGWGVPAAAHGVSRHPESPQGSLKLGTSESAGQLHLSLGAFNELASMFGWASTPMA
jgi:hypothetical protein